MKEAKETLDPKKKWEQWDKNRAYSWALSSGSYTVEDVSKDSREAYKEQLRNEIDNEIKELCLSLGSIPESYVIKHQAQITGLEKALKLLDTIQPPKQS